MKYKPNYDCITNRCGQMPVGWVRGADATPQKIMEQLYSVTGGDGYKFVTIYDCTKEYEVPEKETPIYFMDDILEEVIEYCEIPTIIRFLEKKGYEVKKNK